MEDDWAPVVALGVFVVFAVVVSLGADTGQSLDQRVADLEARVAKLEKCGCAPKDVCPPGSLKVSDGAWVQCVQIGDDGRPESEVEITVSNLPYHDTPGMEVTR